MLRELLGSEVENRGKKEEVIEIVLIDVLDSLRVPIYLLGNLRLVCILIALLLLQISPLPVYNDVGSENQRLGFNSTWFKTD